MVFAVTFAYVHAAQPFFSGDEPHYTVYARSIGEGWGLDLERAHRPENTEPIYGGPLDPHGERYAGPGERLASWHGVGLPLILALPVAAHPSPWTARHVMLLLTAGLAYHLVLLSRRVTGCRPWIAAGATAAVLLAPPVVYYAGLVFPEIPAALLVVLFLRATAASRDAPSATLPRVGAAVLAAGLLWLGLRYAVLAGSLLGGFWLLELHRHRCSGPREVARRTALLAVPAAVVGVGLLAFNLELYGSPAPPQDAPSGFYRTPNLYIYGIGGVLGFPNGVVPLAPMLLVSLASVLPSVRRFGYAVAGVALAVAAYLAASGYFGSPGFGAPGRYQVAVVPLAAVLVAATVAHGRAVARGGVLVLGALTVLSSVTSTSKFDRLFELDRTGIEPIHATARLWPFAVEDRRAAGWTWPASSLPHGTGTVAGDALVAREGVHGPGPLAFGPYVQLQPGRYAAGFELAALSADPVVVFIDVHDLSKGVIAERSLTLEGRTARLESVEFRTDGSASLEFRLWWPGEGSVALREVRADLVEALPTRRTRGEAWKAAAWLAALAAANAVWWRSDNTRARYSISRDRAHDPDAVP